jgi:hypothetical protein
MFQLLPLCRSLASGLILAGSVADVSSSPSKPLVEMKARISVKHSVEINVSSNVLMNEVILAPFSVKHYATC